MPPPLRRAVSVRCAVLSRTDMAKMKKAELAEYIWTAQSDSSHHRRRLDDARPSITHKFIIHSGAGDHSCYITVGFYDEERAQPGEVFLRMGKMGSTLNGLLDTIGILISYGLQYGVPLSDLVGKLQGMTFEPSGPTSNTDIETCSSIIDYVFRWLDKEFSLFDRPPSTSPLVEEDT